MLSGERFIETGISRIHGQSCRVLAASLHCARMFAIVEIVGFQEKVEKGMKLRVPLLSSNADSNLTFDKVLLVADGADIRIGTPLVVGACVEAKILGHGRHDKIRVQKFKRRKRYRRVKGHRQDYTEVEVMKITA